MGINDLKTSETMRLKFNLTLEDAVGTDRQVEVSHK